MPFAASDISITYDGVEISDRVLYSQSSFSMQANPISGSFRLVIKDEDQTFDPATGKKIAFSCDGVPLMGGYVMRIGRGNFFPADATTVPDDVRSRKWVLTGPDFNILFDKRVIHDPGNPKTALVIPEAQRTLSRALTYLFDHFVDAIPGLDTTTFVDDIDVDYGTDSGLYVQQGSMLRAQMEDFNKWGATIYYIDSDFKLHFHEYESIRRPWAITDSHPDGVNTIGFREGEYEQDFSQIVTDALVWGGSSLPAPGPEGNVVFARYPSGPIEDQTIFHRLQSAAKEQQAVDRQALYGRWQMAEMNIGEDNYLTLGSVKHRAYVIVAGASGVPPTYGIEGGFNKPLERFTGAWFAHDVPGGAHLRPGEIVDILLYTQDVYTSLPLRSLNVSFPTLPTSNPAHEPLSYVRFDGEFGTSFSDSRHLWKYLKKVQARARQTRPTYIVTNQTSEGGAEPGSTAQFYPLQPPDGVATTFVFPFAFVAGSQQVYLNSLLQVEGTNYTVDQDGGVVFASPVLQAGDELYATGIVEGTPGVPTPSNASVWGPAFAMDTKVDERVDGTNKVSVRFRATTTSTITSIAWQSRTGPGYSIGAPILRMSIQTDASGVPSGTILASVDIVIPITNTGTVRRDSFGSPPSVTAGTVYHVVWQNVSGNPTSNYSAVNQTLHWDTYAPRQPDDRWSGDYADVRGSAGSWTTFGTHTADVDITYANGTHDGQRYLEAMVGAGTIASIGGTNNMARQTLDPASGDKATTGAGVYVRRTSGAGNLMVGLYTGAGAVIDSFTIPSSSIPIIPDTYDGWSRAGVWVEGTWSTTRTLTNGQSYYLRLSAPSGTEYRITPMRHFDFSGGETPIMLSWYFSEGSGQKTTNGGSSWARLYTGSVNDQTSVPCYLRLA